MLYSNTESTPAIPSIRLFLGRVEHSDPATHVSIVAPLTAGMPTRVKAVTCVQTFSKYFGVRKSAPVESGSFVLCVDAAYQVCFIICTIPDQDFGRVDFPARALIGQGDAAVYDSNTMGYQAEYAKVGMMGGGRPSDVVEGEDVTSNDLGVLIGIFRHMALMKGSELAQIQCYIMDDLVRMISHNFEHYTALGEFKVYHDGKNITAEFGATHQPAESYGQPTVKAPLGTTFAEAGPNIADDSVDYYSISEERLVAVERFKYFLGTFGDFFNAILSRPNQEVTTLDGTQRTLPDTGLAQMRIATDGGIYWRSAKEVFIEKTNWIRVPQRVYAPDDPNGDNGSETELEQKVLYQFENNFRGNDNPFLYFLQIRNYVAYVNEKLGYQNFSTFAKDFSVSKDLGEETLLEAITQVDPNTLVQFGDWQLRTSGIYLMPNGGITIKDAWGSAQIMEGGHIYHQAAKDHYIQPLRNLVARVGQFVSIAAQYDIDFSSTMGGSRWKTYNSQYFYSDNSGIVLESNAQELSKGTPEGKAITDLGGIVLKSNQGIYNYAEQAISLVSGDNLVVDVDEIDVFVTNDIKIASSDLYLQTQQDIALIAGGAQYSIATSDWIAGGIGTTALGQKGNQLGVQYAQDNPFVDPIEGLIDLNTIASSFQDIVPTSDNILNNAPAFTQMSDYMSLKFYYLDSSTYGNLDPTTTDPIPMTMAQQEDDLSGLYGLSAWKETEINGTYPYPGSDNFGNAFASTSGGIPNLQVYSGNDYTGKADSTPTKVSITNSSLNSYKVQPKS